MPRRAGAPQNESRTPPTLIAAAVVVLLLVAARVWTTAVAPAMAHGMLPRWDLAAHVVNGWTTYSHVASGRLLAFAWDLWTQSYWPPGQSLFQVPFYAAFAGQAWAASYSSLGAFVLTGVGAVGLLGMAAGRRAWVAAAVAIGFIITSPFFLAYAGVAMSEMVGALAQVVVLVCYARYEQAPSVAAMRRLALALSALFFTKYNYFILLAVPLACHVVLRERVLASPTAVHAGWRALARWLATPHGAGTAGYAVLVAVTLALGGFSFAVGERLVAFRTVGYSLHPLLYGWLAYAWYTHRRGRWHWPRLRARAPHVATLVVWCVVPITVWLASPVPNHIKDLVYLVVNVPMGPPSAQLGLRTYATAVVEEYFAHPGVFAVSGIAFLVAAARFRRQPSLIRLLITTAVLQAVMVTLHHTRDPRFLLLAMVPFWVVAAHEIGGAFERRAPAIAGLAAVAALAASVATSAAVTTGEPFRRLAFEHYVANVDLADALAAVRRSVPPGGRVAVIGRRDAISPSLMKWQLGPPSGLAEFPVEIAREADLPQIDAADVIVVVDPSEVSVERATRHVTARVTDGTLTQAEVFPLPDLGATIRVFRR